MADLLIFLEEWEWARQGMIEELSKASGQRFAGQRGCERGESNSHALSGTGS
jgi:hypothetical protein